MFSNLTGQMVGKYRILEELGRGGMAVVYRAHDTQLDRLVAIKFLAPHLAWDTEFSQRFYAEARLVAGLRHPHIVTVYDNGMWQGQPFLVMEFLSGQSLANLAQGAGPWPAERVVPLIRQIASALDYAHAHGMIHRDVKPANILVSPEGQATLTDFGLARALESTRLTHTGVMMGTPAYMSPEQAQGGETTSATDIYSLGIVAYELLGGRTPFQAPTSHALLYAHIHEPPPSLDRLNPAISPALAAVIHTALAKQPQARYGTAGAFAAALADAAAGRTVAGGARPGQGQPDQAAGRRWWPLVGLAGALLLVALATLGVLRAMRPPVQEAAVLQQAAALGPGIGGLGQNLPAAALPATATPPPATLAPSTTPIPSTATPVPSTATPVSPTATPIPPTATPVPSATPTPATAVGPRTRTPTATDAAASAWRQGRLAYFQQRDNDHDLYVLDLAAGRAPERLRPGSSDKGGGVLWSPDGRQLAFYREQGGTVIVQAQPGAEPRLVPNCRGTAWSPGGRRIVCQNRGESSFLIRDSQSGALLTEITHGMADAFLPSWSPDSSTLVFVMAQGSSPNTTTSIWRLPVAGGASQALASAASENYAPTWSPDGQWIAYQSNQGRDLSEVWVMDAEGKRARQITHTRPDAWSRGPAWSPDGQWLAFVSNQDEGSGPDYGEVYAVSLATGQIRRVTQTGGQVYDWRVTWGISP